MDHAEWYQILIPKGKMKRHRYISLMKSEIEKYNIRYRELSEFTSFSIIKIKRIMNGKQRVALEEFDLLRDALVKIKKQREGKAMPDSFLWLDKLYGEDDFNTCDEDRSNAD